MKVVNVSHIKLFQFYLKLETSFAHMKIIVSGEIHLRGKTGPLGALGDGIAKVGNQVFLNNPALVKMCLTHEPISPYIPK